MKHTFDTFNFNTDDLLVENNVLKVKTDYYFVAKFRLNNDFDNKVDKPAYMYNFAGTPQFIDDYCRFDNAAKYIIDIRTLIQNNSPWTISFWYRGDSSNTAVNLTNFNSSQCGWKIYTQYNTNYNKGFPTIYLKDANGHYCFVNSSDYSTAPLNPNTWYHICYVFDGVELKTDTLSQHMKLYINGVEFTTNLNYGGNNNLVGSINTGLNTAVASARADTFISTNRQDLKDIRIFNRQLDSNEVSYMYNNIDSFFYKIGSFPAETETFFDAFYNKYSDIILTNSAGVDKFRLISDSGEYYFDGNYWITPINDSDWNTLQEIKDNINNFGFSPLGFKFLIESDGYVFDSIQNIILSYSLTESTNIITYDNINKTNINFFKGEKKLIRLKYYLEDGTLFNLNYATDSINIEIYYQNDILKDTITDYDIIDQEIFFNIDLSDYEYGRYYIILTITRGSTFIDIDKSLTLIIS